MVRPYLWFLDRVGAEGIKLTTVGHLPPADVEAAVIELGLPTSGSASTTARRRPCPCSTCASPRCAWPAAQIPRHAAGHTPRRKLREDPISLWWHLAEQLPPTKIARHVTHAGLLLLATVGAGSAAGDDPLEYVARMLGEVGWANRDATPVTKWQARDAAADTYITLVRLGALARDLRGPGPDHPTRDGALFARAALRTWPA